MTKLLEFATREAQMSAAAERIAETLKLGISGPGHGYAALSGGSTPVPAYEALAKMPLDWSRVTFLLVDERFVPPSDAASNEGVLRRALAPALAGGAKLLPMYSADVGLDEAAARANTVYINSPIDIALLGMGEDGHVASWFPQSAELDAILDPTEPRAVAAVTAEGAAGSSQRLTLTRAGLERSQALVLLITGAEKRALIENTMRGRLPVDALQEMYPPLSILWAP